jgi:hypothetical protein
MPAPESAVVTIKAPFAVRKRGGRKLVLAPGGAPVPPLAPQVDSTLAKPIARAFRWQKMLETGRYATIKEIARTEKINPSYVSRVLRLTLLAPATVEAILDGRPTLELTLAQAMAPFPIAWVEQSDCHHRKSHSQSDAVIRGDGPRAKQLGRVHVTKTASVNIARLAKTREGADRNSGSQRLRRAPLV